MIARGGRRPRGYLVAAALLGGCSAEVLPVARNLIVVTLSGVDEASLLPALESGEHPGLVAWAGVRRSGGCWSVSTSSRAAHASLWTGQTLPSHGLHCAAQRLPGSATTLAEELSARGYLCAAVLSSELLDRDSGLLQGFDPVDRSSIDEFRLHATGDQAAAVLPYRTARATTRAALQRLTRLSSPFLLWVHLDLRRTDELGELLHALEDFTTESQRILTHAGLVGRTARALVGTSGSLRELPRSMRVPFWLAGVPRDPADDEAEWSLATAGASLRAAVLPAPSVPAVPIYFEALDAWLEADGPVLRGHVQADGCTWLETVWLRAPPRPTNGLTQTLTSRPEVARALFGPDWDARDGWLFAWPEEGPDVRNLAAPAERFEVPFPWSEYRLGLALRADHPLPLDRAESRALLPALEALARRNPADLALAAYRAVAVLTLREAGEELPVAPAAALEAEVEQQLDALARALPHWPLMQVLAALHRTEGGDSRVEARLRRAIAMAPCYFPATRLLASHYQQSLQNQEALAVLEEFSERAPLGPTARAEFETRMARTRKSLGADPP